MMEDGVYFGSGDGGGNDRSGHYGGGVGKVMLIEVAEVIKIFHVPTQKEKNFNTIKRTGRRDY